MILTLREYAALMRESQTSIRRQLRVGACRVQPCMVKPYRWRRADVETFLTGITVVEDRKYHRSLQEARTA